MHHFQFNPQFQSNGMSEPTVALPHQYQPRDMRAQAKSLKKEHPTVYGGSQQHPFARQNQFQRQLEICHSEIETLKQQIQLLQKQKDTLQETIQLLKKERAVGDSEGRRLFQQNQKNRQLVEKLKIDNKSMEMQVQKFRAERKVYYNNLGNIQVLKRDIAGQLAQKNTLIDQTSNKLRKLQRNHSECRIKIQDLQRTVSQGEVQKRQLREELKSTLQKYLAGSSILNKMDFQLKQVNELNKSFKDRIYELQRQRQEMLIKLGYDGVQSRGNLSESQRSNYHPHQRSMIEIQSYMKEIQNILDLKKDDMDKKKKNYDKLKVSIECLEKIL